MWPAFWMLGNNIGTVDWPDCGEIDIMENVGKEPDKVHGTIHGPGYWGGNGLGGSYTLPSGKFADDFHVFAVEWEPSAIRFFVDGHLYETRTQLIFLRVRPGSSIIRFLSYSTWLLVETGREILTVPRPFPSACWWTM
jgi:beta-glucanase (GH16 family)